MIAWRTLITLIAKGAATLSLLWWLTHKLDFNGVWLELLSLSRATILFGTALILSGNILLAIRWGILSKRIGTAIGHVMSIRYGLIGMFFSQVLPSSFGGDGIRMWLLYRDGIQASSVIRSIFLDRLTGLATLCILSLYGLPHLLQQMFSLDPNILFAGMLGCICVAAVLIAVIIKLASWLQRNRIGRLLVQMVYDLSLLVRMNLTFAIIAALSIIGQLLLCSVVWILLRDMNQNVSLIDILTIMPVIFILLVVPISIAGWGLREGLFVTILGQLGIPQDAALIASIVFGILTLLASLVGGVLWITAGSKANKSPEMISAEGPRAPTSGA